MSEEGKPLLPEKEWFNIGEACRLLRVPAHTLRYWEQHFRLLRPSRRDSGHRRYSRGDLEAAFQIKDLLQNKKMTTAGARKALAARRRGGRLPGAASGGAVPPGLVKLLRQAREDLKSLVDELSG